MGFFACGLIAVVGTVGKFVTHQFFINTHAGIRATAIKTLSTAHFRVASVKNRDYYFINGAVFFVFKKLYRNPGRFKSYEKLEIFLVECDKVISLELCGIEYSCHEHMLVPINGRLLSTLITAPLTSNSLHLGLLKQVGFIPSTRTIDRVLDQ
ncbi:hypothetical protein BpHYR1_000338 [Brachionus plicatilis]|uniref:Uncharacterized protein n=1 Tax=Brachionus plicatilis TaxID=10195 RepID=A0A3M7SBZ4_BRAPC|nr:hypothetical protein BpHYR1_000338 [Brachionus plicatilis]